MTKNVLKTTIYTSINKIWQVEQFFILTKCQKQNYLIGKLDQYG